MSRIKRALEHYDGALLGALLLGFLAAGFSAQALDPARSITQYNCQTWRRQNGLTANGIHALAQSKDGYLWLGTSAGLVRFDGIDFKFFDLSHLPNVRGTSVSSLFAAQSGGVWLGLERGSFGLCDGNAVFLWGNDERGGMNLNVHSLLESRQGDLWLAAETVASRLTRGKTYEPILTTTTGTARFDTMSLCEDSRGRVWLGTVQGGLFYWQSGTVTHLPDPELKNLVIYCVTEDQQGRLWVGTHLGLRCYDKNLKNLELIPFPWYPTSALLADRQGAVWVATMGGGLVRYLNGSLTQLRKTEGLADDFVTSLLEDREGSLWVGTRNGLSQLNDLKIPTYGKTEGLTADVDVAVCASQKGGFWVATGDGFTYFDGTARSYGKEVGLAYNYHSGIFEASNGDLYLFNGLKDVEVFSGGRIVARYPNTSWPTAMAEDGEGVVVALGNKLMRAGTNYFGPYTLRDGRSAPMNWTFHMASARNGGIWVGGDEGICLLKEGSARLWGKLPGFTDTKVMWVCEDSDGVVWGGQETGIVRLKDGQLRKITKESGLFDNLIYAIVPDDYGNLWVDSGGGFFRVSRRSLNDFADGKTARVQCVAFNGLDAVKSIEKYQQKPSGCKTRDGRIWFPTAQGVAMIDPTNLSANPVPPAVHIDRVRANGKELRGRGLLAAAPGRGDLEIHYAGVNYIAPLKTQFRYRLSGCDTAWVEAGGRRVAFYANLKPGRYEFQVQACNEDGVWNTVGADCRVELPPRFYETTWFMALVGLLVFVGPAGAYGWRMKRLQWHQRRLEQQQELLEIKVRERTAELAHTNESLAREIRERQQMELEVERVHQDLMVASREAGQAEIASSVLHNVGNVLNSVNVSTSLVTDGLKKMRLASLTKAAGLLEAHAGDLGSFLTTDEKGRALPKFLNQLAQSLNHERERLLTELQELGQNVEHINEIVAMQQEYTRRFGVQEPADASELMNSALKMHDAALRRDAVEVVREYGKTPQVLVDKHKVLQILVNLLQNAKRACNDGSCGPKRVTLRIGCDDGRHVRLVVEDNGVGIAPENMTRIFQHGFTTRADGHGFGLHSAALAAKELGGALTAHSAGPGRGATFALELPLAAADAHGSPERVSAASPS